LANGLGSVGFSWIANPASTELEMVMMNWIVKMAVPQLGYGDQFYYTDSTVAFLKDTPNSKRKRAETFSTGCFFLFVTIRKSCSTKTV
jgi:hypothetical protein